jgi:hypothetical protein
MSQSYASTAAEIAAVEDPVDELRELIAESDRLLFVLEEQNRDGRQEMTQATAFWVALLARRVLGEPLPIGHEARLKVQAALDLVFDEVQPALFWRHCRELGLARIADEPAEEVKS